MDNDYQGLLEFSPEYLIWFTYESESQIWTFNQLGWNSQYYCIQQNDIIGSTPLI